MLAPSLASNDRLFRLAERGQREPSVTLAILVVPATLAIMIVCQVAARGVLRRLLAREPADSVAELLGFSSIFGVLWLLLHFWSRRPFSSLGFDTSGPLRPITTGSAAAIVMMSATAAALILAGASVTSGGFQSGGIGALGAAILGLAPTTVQSSSEEALFRGWLLQSIGVRLGPLAGVLLSSLIFTLAHATTGPPPLGWINLFLFGSVAALFAISEGGLWAACAWHTIWNWTQGGLLGFAVDRSAGGGLIASIHATGPDYITGGAFGPEGGIVVTVVLLAAIGVLWLNVRQQRDPERSVAHTGAK